MRIEIPFKSVLQRKEYLRELTPALGESIVDMMIYKGFCEKPASTRFHGSYAGGLFDHSYVVSKVLENYTEKLGLSWYRPDSPVRIGFLHDICKIDKYTAHYNDDNEITGYSKAEKQIVTGHGDKSVIYALRYGCPLTEEELACILYHMGAYEVEHWENFDAAIRQFPNVLYTHTADMEASKIWNI